MLHRLADQLLDWIKASYLDPQIRLLRLRAAIIYLQGVKKAHQILVLVCLLVFVITLIGAGLVVIPITLLLFAPWEPATKTIVGVVIGAVYLLLPIVALSLLLSEKRWMRMTGAADLLRKLTD